MGEAPAVPSRPLLSVVSKLAGGVKKSRTCNKQSRDQKNLPYHFQPPSHVLITSIVALVLYYAPPSDTSISRKTAEINPAMGQTRFFPNFTHNAKNRLTFLAALRYARNHAGNDRNETCDPRNTQFDALRPFWSRVSCRRADGSIFRKNVRYYCPLPPNVILTFLFEVTQSITTQTIISVAVEVPCLEGVYHEKK